MITLDYLMGVHSYLEAEGYCASGIRDKNLLYSAIGGQDWFDNDIDKVLHVAYSICANHVFIEGNKCTAFIIVKYIENPLPYTLDTKEIAKEILELATYSTEKAVFIQQIKKSIY